MADYYVMYQGTKYEVDDYSAGIAKAKELGSEAVFYVDAQLPDSKHTFCEGVNVVFSGGYAAGTASKRYIFGGLSGSGEAESTSYTITGGVYNYVFGGSYNGAVTKNTEVTITGGTFNYVFAGGWPKVATEAPYENVVVNFGGGEVTQLCGCNYSGSVKNATINITGGFVRVLYAVAGANGGDIHVEKLTVNVSGGTVGNKNFSIRAKVGKTAANTIGDVVLNLTGGTGQASILGTEQTPGTATYKSVTINVDGINHSGKLVAGIYGCAPTDFVTVNVKSGVVGNVYGGSYGVSSLPSGMDMLEISCPLTVNVSGGTAGTVYGGSNSPKVSYKGTITVNLSGGTVAGIVTSGGGKNGTVEGDLITNISGGVLGNTGVYGGVYDASTTHVGNCYVTITGGTTGAGSIYGGGYSGEQTGDCTLVIEGGAFKAKTYGGSRVGQVNGNVTTIIRGGGTTESASYWTVGGGLSSVITGKATIKVENGRVHHIFMGAGGEGGQVLGGTDLTVTGSYITGAIQGGGYRGDVEGGTKVTITGSTIARDAFTSYGSEGYIVGASASDKSNTIGDMVTSVSNSIVNGTIVGGGRAGYCEGNVSLTVTDCTLGIFIDAVDEETGEEVKELYGGDIFAMGGSNNYFEFVGNANVTVSGVEALGGLYAVYGNALVQGNTTVTVSNSSFADGIFLEHGSWTEEEVEDGNVVTEAKYRESEINGNVVYNLTNVTVTGDVWGKGRNFDLASFVEEDQGVTLAVSGKLTVSGEVAYFQNITIAAGATIEANNVIASAITLDIAAVTETAATVITGFKAQDSAITLTANGTVLSTVTLSEVITSGRFINGSEVITVAVTDDQLTIQKAAVSADTVSGGASNTVLSEGTFDVAFTGGNRTAEATDFEGNYTIQLDDGNFNKAVTGGDTVTGAVNVTRTGNIDLVINGGTFSSNTRVCGGMFYNPNSAIEDKTAGSANLIGDVNFTIAGGRFDSRVFGGNNAKNDELGSRTMIDGSVNLTIDAGTAAITFNEHVLAGSRGSGAITGNTNVTITGKGDNLTFGADSVLFGGSNSDVVKVRANGSVDVNSAVLGDRNLIFSAFEGDFDAEIRLFNTISFVQNSTVDFTDAMLNLRAVSEWNFDFGSTASGIAVNDFAGDILNFNDLEGNVSPDGWVAISQSAIANLDQARIFLDGVEATSGVDGTWTTDLYQLKVDEDGTRLVIASLA